RKSRLVCDALLAEICHRFDAGIDAASPCEGSEADGFGLPAQGRLEGKLIAIYSAMKSEVSLASFVPAAFALGARLCFPCMLRRPDFGISGVSRETAMVFCEVTKAQYEAGGIPFMEKPLSTFSADEALFVEFPPVTAQEIDVAVVPLVAFDKDFNRLGYGGGNYDRFLPKLRLDAHVFGLAFAEQEVDCVPAEAHDLPLPLILFA
ncbi:MAG: hypothetical protein FWE65_01355, partial [Eggerthellaceae bacterium]|nr:hypothetical protein [Eggerthellaceae bacterium]